MAFNCAQEPFGILDLFLGILPISYEKIFIVGVFPHFRSSFDDLRCFFRKMTFFYMKLIEMCDHATVFAAVKLL